MHDGRLSAIERAMQLASSGVCQSPADIRAALGREGYDGIDALMNGMSFKKKLKELMTVQRKTAAAETAVRIVGNP
jgi:hypothetical protein